MRLGTKAILSPKTDIKSLELQLRVEAKRANQRLRQIEKSNLETKSRAWKTIRDFSYDGREFMGETKHDEFKFKTTTRGRTREEIVAELLELEKFLYKSKTSTVKGTRQAKKNLMDAMKKQNEAGTKSEKVINYFGSMSEDEFDDFWELANLKRLIDMYGSDDAVEIIERSADMGIDEETLNRILGDILNDSEKSIMSIMDEISTYSPTGEII